MPWFDGIAADAAGRLVATVEGARAFLPDPLPTGLSVPASTQRLLADARGELGKLWGIGRLLRNPRLFVGPLQAREAAASSRIEGTKTTNEEALANEAVGVDPAEDRDGQEVQNYLRALAHGTASLHQGRALNRSLLLELHRTLLDGVRGQTAVPGRFRESQAFLGKETDTIHTARFVPPPAIHIDVCMEQLQEYLDDRAHDDPLVRAALVHYQFETIHPFLDGNGRIGRLLVPLYLVSHGILVKPSLYLSDFFERNRGSYYDALTRARLSGDLIHWVRFFLRGVAETSAKGRDTFGKILALRIDVEQRILILGKRVPNARAALNLLYRRPVVAASDLGRQLDVSAPTAQALLKDLIRLGILTEITGQMRGRLYAFQPYLDLFIG